MGYWTDALDTPNAAGTAPARQDAAHINTWVAGMPSITLPATGVGTLSGNALGSVVNGRASYLAAGGFTNSCDFGTHTGTVTISDFDSKTVIGTANGVNAGYSGTLSGSGVAGQPAEHSLVTLLATRRPRPVVILHFRVLHTSLPASSPVSADGRLITAAANARRSRLVQRSSANHKGSDRALPNR
jgi:hypothetical protein